MEINSSESFGTGFVELHVLFVPCDQWNVKLNKISAKATESFISAGFIRVYPDITLRTLRAELAAFLGGEKDVNKFSFLRCVGQSLAVVKSSQEKDLKVKTFAPPYAAQPELYLLPAVEADSSFCSRSVTTDTSSSSPEQQICYQPLKLCDVPTGTKKNKPTAGVCGGLDSVKPASPVTNSKLCSHAQDLMLLLLITTNVLFLKGEELIETLKLVKEERRELEWTRQQLLRKGKDFSVFCLACPHEARDSWKKKYFGTKKATAPLEDKLRQLKLELETLYNKALHQLQIRKSLGKPLRQGRTSGKNELIIQIMKENFEIDNMKRKVEDAEMKLITEMKLRKQAATELGALKVELAQKRSQSSHPGLTGNTAREKMQVSSTTSLLGSNSVAHV
uniref:Spermatosis associated 1 n=1 Tax=Nothobranchius furzeri TaxID=105023 RepID=A0A8C6QBK9_NOTFU